jgi:hypothetical protein
MTNDTVEIIITDRAGGSAAHVDRSRGSGAYGRGRHRGFPWPAEPGGQAGPDVARCACCGADGWGAGLAVLPGSSRGGGDLTSAAKVVIGVVLLLALCSAEVWLHFGLRLDAIITTVAIWGFWRWCLRGGARWLLRCGP